MITEKGESISEVVRILDISEPALRILQNAAKEPTNSENSRIKELVQKIWRLKKENDDLQATVNVLKE